MQRNVVTGLLPGAFPASSNLRADLGAIVIAEMDAIVRRVRRISLVDRNENEFRVERERANVPGKTCLRSFECADLRHGNPFLLMVGRWVQCVGARHW